MQGAWEVTLTGWSFAGVNPLGGDVGCWQSLPGWQTFDVTSSLEGRDSVWDRRAFSSLSTLKLLSCMRRAVWDKSELTMLMVCFGNSYPSYFPSLQLLSGSGCTAAATSKPTPCVTYLAFSVVGSLLSQISSLMWL